MEFEIPADYDPTKDPAPAKYTEPITTDMEPPFPEEQTQQQTPEEDQPRIQELPEETPKPRRMSRELKNLKQN